MSRGRSITTDLPTPRGTKREVLSPATSWMTCVPCSAAGVCPEAMNPNAKIIAVICMVRISGTFAMMVPSLYRLFRCRRADAETNHIDALPRFRVAIVIVGSVEVDDAAERERKHPHQLGARKHFGLMRRELECRGLADHHALAVLVLDGLIDRQHPDVGEDDLARMGVGSGRLVGVLVVAPRQDDVDMVVRENEARGAGVGRDVDRDCPLALGQDRGHVSGALGLDQLGLADRLAVGKGLAGYRSCKLIDGVGIGAPANEV